MKHKISGIILEQLANCDCDKIIFIDTSKYKTEVTNPLLRIYPPNWNKYVDVLYAPSAVTIISGNSIKHTSLPDGVYNIIQSVCPNDKTEISFCYFHYCCLMKDLKESIADNLDNPKILENLFTMKMNLDILNDIPVDKATEMYNNVSKDLKKLKKECNGMC